MVRFEPFFVKFHSNSGVDERRVPSGCVFIYFGARWGYAKLDLESELKRADEFRQDACVSRRGFLKAGCVYLAE